MLKSLLKKTKLLQGLLNGETAYTGPSYVDVDVTHSCNLRCLHCRCHSLFPGKPPSSDSTFIEVPFALVEKLCNEVSNMGTDLIVFVGEGEPMLHPRIFDMITVAKERGLDVIMFTNGILLDECRIKSLLESRLDTLRVSFWASSPEEYEMQHPGANPENFNKIIENLHLLTRLKKEHNTVFPRVELSHPINRFNLNSTQAIIDLAQEVRCDKLLFYLVNAVGGEEFRPLLLSPDEKNLAHRSLLQAKERLDSLAIQHDISNLLNYRFDETGWKKLPCYVAWYHAYLKANGDIVACHRCDIPMGNLEEHSFYEIWNNTAFRTFRKNTLACNGLISMSNRCRCDFCCHIVMNNRIHQVDKWLSPLRKNIHS